MRSALPAGTHQAQIQQIVESVEFAAAQDVGPQVSPSDSGPQNRRAPRGSLPSAQPMTPRAGEKNADAGFRLANLSHDFREHVRPLLPFWPVRSKGERRVGMKIADHIGVSRQPQLLAQCPQIRHPRRAIGKNLRIHAIGRQLRTDPQAQKLVQRLADRAIHLSTNGRTARNSGCARRKKARCQRSKRLSGSQDVGPKNSPLGHHAACTIRLRRAEVGRKSPSRPSGPSANPHPAPT